MRLIDADALLWKITHALDWSEADTLSELRNAPTLQPEGDAISRAGLLADFERYKSNHHPYTAHLSVDNCIANIKNFPSLPSLPVAAPDVDVDRVTAEDVVPGIEWGVRSSHWNKTARLSSNGGIYLEFCDGPDYLITKDQCVDLLNGALRRGETINWPEGHPRNPKKPKEPTLLEVLQEAVDAYGKPGGPWSVPSDPGGWLERARAAIEAERKGKHLEFDVLDGVMAFIDHVLAEHAPKGKGRPS